MYLDTVLANNGKVLFNGTPAEMIKWLDRMSGWDTLLGDDPHVIGGYSLRAYTVEDYIKFHKEM